MSGDATIERIPASAGIENRMFLNLPIVIVKLTNQIDYMSPSRCI